MKPLFPIIPHAKMWIVISIIIMAIGIGLFITYQRYSIQFTGGVELVVDTPTLPSTVPSVVHKALTDSDLQPEEVTVGQKDKYASLLVQMELADDTQVQQVTNLLKKTLVDNQVISSPDQVLEQTIIGPTIGEYMEKSAIKAIIFGSILMAIYILFAFAGIRTLISPALLGVIIVVTTIFDIAFPAGMYGLWMAINPAIQIDAVFIIAILTIMGYSINDTIIIFDRVRENYLRQSERGTVSKSDIAQLFEKSLWQTMRRSLGTSMTVFLVVVAMWIFGTGSLKSFAFTFGMGVISGSFSSIFLSATLAYLFSVHTLEQKKA